MGTPHYFALTFIGLPGGQNKPPREKHCLEHSDDPRLGDGGGDDSDAAPDDEPKNSGTIILDATYAPQNISYPQDINLLNEVRGNLEKMIDEICYNYYKPRMYRRNARRDYLNLAKCKNALQRRSARPPSCSRNMFAGTLDTWEHSFQTALNFHPGRSCG